MSTDLRSHLRVNLPEGYFLEFRSGEHVIQNARLLNVGCGGCCLEWDPAQGEEPRTGALLEDLVLRHESLPSRPQRAQVIWVLGGRSKGGGRDAQSNRLLIGIRFLKPAQEFQIQIYEFVAGQLGYQIVA